MPKDIGTIPAASEERILFQLFKITLLDGTILRYTDADLDIAHDVGDGAGIQTWAVAPGVDRSEVRAGMDLQIDTLNLRVRNIDLTLGGITRPLAHWAKVRKFHGAAVDLFLYAEQPAPVTSAQHSSWTVQGAQGSTDEAEIRLESILAKLDIQIPRTIFQRECNNALYDQYCGVIQATFLVTSTAAAVTIASVTYGTLTPSTPPVLPAYVDGYFDWGQIEFISGNLLGLKQTIATHLGSVLTFYAPFPEIPDVGSSIKLWPGCHKTIADCRDKFAAQRTAPTNWRQRFRGFPYMPEMEETIG